MAEIGGEGALYHDGTNHEELAIELEKALTLPDVRGHLIGAGLKNVARFTWQSHIRTVTSVCEEVAAACRS
jgi:hypothetical protein